MILIEGKEILPQRKIRARMAGLKREQESLRAAVGKVTQVFR